MHRCCKSSDFMKYSKKRRPRWINVMVLCEQHVGDVVPWKDVRLCLDAERCLLVDDSKRRHQQIWQKSGRFLRHREAPWVLVLLLSYSSRGSPLAMWHCFWLTPTDLTTNFSTIISDMSQRFFHIVSLGEVNCTGPDEKEMRCKVWAFWFCSERHLCVQCESVWSKAKDREFRKHWSF